MKYYLYTTFDKVIIREFETTYSMTLDEAILAIGGEIKHEADPTDPNVIIDGKEYWYDDLDMTVDITDING